MGLGLLAALPVIITGLADWSSIKREKPAWKLGVAHMTLNLIATLTFGLNFGLRLEQLDEADPITTPILLSSSAGTVLLFISGYLGSLMSFDHGIGVARGSKDKWRKIAAAGGSNLAEEK